MKIEELTPRQREEMVRAFRRVGTTFDAIACRIEELAPRFAAASEAMLAFDRNLRAILGDSRALELAVENDRERLRLRQVFFVMLCCASASCIACCSWLFGSWAAVAVVLIAQAYTMLAFLRESGARW